MTIRVGAGRWRPLFTASAVVTADAVGALARRIDLAPGLGTSLQPDFTRGDVSLMQQDRRLDDCTGQA